MPHIKCRGWGQGRRNEKNIMEELFEIGVAETKFRRLKTDLGREVALFTMCAVLDVPYKAHSDAETWQEYLDTLTEAGINVSASENGFRTGEISIQTALQADMSDEERWLEVWGHGNAANPYTAADYKRLDRLYQTYSARLMSAGGPDPQQEFILRSICTDQLLADRCRDLGTKESIETYTKLTKTIQEKLGAENLRKKDILPMQEQRPDGFVDKLKQKYGVDGSLTYEQAMQVFYRWLHSHSYPETTDAADNYLLAVINCTRRNNDTPELDELPKNYKFDKDFNCEFADDPNDMEREAYRYLGLNRKDGK